MLVFVLLYVTLCLFLYCNHLEKDEKASCFAIFALQMLCYYKCSVALLHGAMGWSTVCDRDIS